ncbi:MAG: hypothetical protein WD045_12835, partial [Pirellulaceae bacterium]
NSFCINTLAAEICELHPFKMNVRAEGPGLSLDLNALIAYIDNQEQHHRTRSFQDELRMFLKKYGVQFDEAYVWD